MVGGGGCVGGDGVDAAFSRGVVWEGVGDGD